MWKFFKVPSYLTSIAALLGMIVGYHFLGPSGVALSLGIVIAFIVVRAKQGQNREEHEALRRALEQDELR